MIEPWNYWLATILELCGDRAGTVFAEVQNKTVSADLCGFIVARWNQGNEPDDYWSGSTFKPMNDPTETPYPYIFRTLTGVKRVIERLRKYEGLQIGLCFWIAPEASEISFIRWKDLQLTASGPKTFGNHFPGCPRR